MRRLVSLGDGHIVVDAWSALNDYTLAFMDVSTHLVIVATPQVTALRDTHRALEALQLLDYDLDRVLLVLNNCYHRSAFRLREVERALGRPVAEVVEYSPNEVTASLNRGIPLFQEYEHSPAAQSILQLAQLISSRDKERPQLGTLKAKPTLATSPKKERRGLFRWSFRRPVGEMKA
jgi:pilus assembly protein CpaE